MLSLACVLLPALGGCRQNLSDVPATEVASEVPMPTEAAAETPPPPVEPVLPVAWEYCPNASGNTNFSRTPVPMGWLLRVGGEKDHATFVPDPEHAWLRDAPRTRWMGDTRVPELHWERFESGERLATPAGWLVILPDNYYNNDAVYVPDPEHRWLADLPLEAPEGGGSTGG